MTAFELSVVSRSEIDPRRYAPWRREPLTVALVNNMPDSALIATERQFRRLISLNGDQREIRLQVFFLPEILRSEAGRAYCESHYRPVEELIRSQVDGLVVTGCEPRADALTQEPFWDSFGQLVDWAKHNTGSALWSCLAAHAAVLHLDRIQRYRLPKKLSGVYACQRMVDHLLVAGAGELLYVPHSRYNGLRETDLLRHGYDILSRSDEVEVDMFAKRVGSFFVFLQGHPEYDGDSLEREFRRDVRRFLAHERESFPELPKGYFDETASAALTEFGREALTNRNPSFESRLPVIGSRPPRHDEWQEAAVRLYGRWLSLVGDARREDCDRIGEAALL
jgi:homoserine O-succinyltransferase